MSDLAQLQYRYARAVDTRDIDGIVACFTDDADVAYNGGQVQLHGADDIRRFFEQAFANPLLGSSGASTHLLANVLIDGDHVETHGVAYLASDDRDTVIVRGLVYKDDCVLGDDGRWRINRRVHTPVWEGEMARRPLSPALEAK